MIFRYKITVEYLGTNLAGWQRQENSLSVQQIIEEAIVKVTGEIVNVIGAGRTDAGVHALGQVAHFDLSRKYEPDKLLASLNFFMRPHPVGINACKLVDNDFHARFDAKQRYYKYLIINRQAEPVLLKNKVWWIRASLDTESMSKACQYFIGKHDFNSFRAKHCQAKSSIRTISNLSVQNAGDKISVYISAQSFLHHMVRNIVGTLVEVGLSRRSPHDIPIILESKTRSAAGRTAPAHGLCFTKVEY